MTRRPLAAVCATLALVACSLERPLPAVTTYSIEPPAAAVPIMRRPETLRLGSVRVASAFDSRELVYRLDDVRFTTDFYNRFLAPPGQMLGTLMADWLNRAGPFRAVTQPGIAPPAAPFVLEAVVTELYGDFRPNRKPEAVITIQFYLLTTAGLAPQMVLERSIGRRIELSQQSPEGLVLGYSSALSGILTELTAEIAKSSVP